ncbi:MAG TPA: DUF749 family protein [Thermoplasmata archaeon]|nr:DUF749 family protein [Thermoplasmata archaeon]
MYRADLIAVTPAGSVPDDLRPFMEFKASLLKRELKKEQVVALFLIATTSCYIPVFLDKGTTLDDVRKDLAEQQAEIPAHSLRIIEEALKRLDSEKKK